MLGFTQQDADDVNQMARVLRTIDKNEPLQLRLDDLADRLEREANRYVIDSDLKKEV